MVLNLKNISSNFDIKNSSLTLTNKPEWMILNNFPSTQAIDLEAQLSSSIDIDFDVNGDNVNDNNICDTLKFNLVTETNSYPIINIPLKLRHTLTILAPFGSIYTKPENKNAKAIFPNHNPPLNEIDTLAVRFLKADLANWGPLVPFARKESGAEVLQSEFSFSNLITENDGDYVIHKYPFKATGLYEGKN